MLAEGMDLPVTDRRLLLDCIRKVALPQQCVHPRNIGVIDFEEERELMRRFRNFRGFSYAELMLVGVVLAILAAVAVPRYRQADTLTKYAQVLDNFGQIQVALDAYKADAGEFPETDMGLAAYALGKRTIHRLTTPMAYLPSIPASPFAETVASPPGSRAEGNVLYTRRWLTNPASNDPNFSSDASAFVFQGQFAPGLSAFVSASDWSLRSVGPDGIDDRLSSAPGFGAAARVYDVTNGIDSRGDIVWFSNSRLSQNFVTSTVGTWEQYE